MKREFNTFHEIRFVNRAFFSSSEADGEFLRIFVPRIDLRLDFDRDSKLERFRIFLLVVRFEK